MPLPERRAIWAPDAGRRLVEPFCGGLAVALGLRPALADPPHDVEFTQYARRRVSWDDQERTAARFARHPGPVVLVNQATKRIEELCRRCGYRVVFLNAPRRISCTGDRTPAREGLATRNV